jgi:hypothetical protein
LATGSSASSTPKSKMGSAPSISRWRSPIRTSRRTSRQAPSASVARVSR